VIEALLSHPTIQVNRGKGETTPLFMAAKQGRQGVVKMLLDCKDVDINKTSTDGITPSFLDVNFHQSVG
jgi:hypothetical protein